MITVKVTEMDIRRGRTQANKSCGCPVWLALKRSLRKVTCDNSKLEIVNVNFAKFAGFKILLPDEAVDFQSALMEDFSADVKPLEFECDIEIAKR